jgi:hypothetical protein
MEQEGTVSRTDEIMARVAEYRAALKSDEPDAGIRATLAKISIDSWAVADLEHLLGELQSKETALRDLKVRFMGVVADCNSCQHKNVETSDPPCCNCKADNSKWAWDGETATMKGAF